MIPHHEQASRAVAVWDIQESLLQSYRALFVTAESIVFGLAATVMSSAPDSCLVLGVLGLCLIWLWHETCVNRAIDVSFVQWLAIQAEEGRDTPAPLGALKSFQDGEIITVDGRRVWRRGPTERTIGAATVTRDERYSHMLRSRSRTRMEVQLPAAFVILWIGIAAVAVKTIATR